jgi:starvation-inducible DNA-binding protein
MSIDIGIDATTPEEMDEDSMPNAQDMIRRLVGGHETVARTARQVFKGAESVSDQPTCDLLTQRMQVHEKTASMLRSLLEQAP